MIQTELPFDVTHARPTDPDTSHEAAQQAEGPARRHKRIIVGVLRVWGPLASYEIADRCAALDYWQVTRRISDLRRDGKVEDSGARRLTPNGRPAGVWRLVVK